MTGFFCGKNMFATYTNLKEAHFRNIGKAGQYADTTLLADFQYNLGQRYQLIWGKLSSYISQDSPSTPAATVAGTQYYTYPVGTVGIDSMYITVGSQKYTLTPIYDQQMWNYWNSLPIQPTTFPQFFFPRKDDFGIWPIPQDAYTFGFQRFFRDRNLLVDDYTDGSVAIVSGSSTVTGTLTTFTQAMVGRWFTITDTSVPGQGFEYKITGFTSTTVITISPAWVPATLSGKSFRIGEAPEIPAEAHSLLSAGTAADFYAGLRSDPVKATWWNNVFWTGDGGNNVRDITSKNVSGGLIALIKDYKDRDRDNIVERRPQIQGPYASIFSQTIS